jgi:alpha-L-fucosidase
MRKIFPAALLAAAALLSGCSQRGNTYFEKKLAFPDLLTSDQKVKLSAYIVPSQNQYEWQQMELTAFIHFGINTFTGKEWSNGKEDPALFNPTDFDAEQWASTLHDAGFKMLVLTAKNRDGFCLWPTETTAYSVASSPWRNGLGDVVKEVKEACEKYDLKLGIYLAPRGPLAQQLAELLSNYGEVREVRLDETAHWAYRMVDSIQPKAIMSDEVRRNGLGRETEWSVTPLHPNAAYWYPSEVDASIRPSRFYHPEEDKEVKSLQQLVDIYFQSVGMNSTLILNIPPDKRGRLHETDTERLRQFGAYIARTFGNEKLSNGNMDWKAPAGTSREFHVMHGEKINTVMIQEDIRKGQRVEAFTVEGLLGDEWVKLAAGTTIGHKRLLRFGDVSVSKLRITVGKTRADANIAKVGAYYAPHLR